MSFADIIRTGDEKGLLLSDLEKWNEYRKMRNITSHTYDESKADDIVSNIPDFIAEVGYFLNQLRKKTGSL
jgi:nucleotidyltransferase substrate binding protein (TIGR01987 family)